MFWFATSRRFLHFGGFAQSSLRRMAASITGVFPVGSIRIVFLITESDLPWV
jgi:hypothetical protein